MIGIEEITSPALIDEIRQKYFVFETPSYIPVIIHRIIVDGLWVGYVATEDFQEVAAPHMYIHEHYRNAEYLGKVGRFFDELYCPLMKSNGARWLVTNCDQTDSGTQNFLKKLGFSIKKIAVAEYAL